MRDQALYQEIERFFSERLNISGTSPHADLFETGVLDSLTFVDLIMHLEQQFDILVVSDELEPENFRSVERIAAFISVRSGLKNVGAA